MRIASVPPRHQRVASTPEGQAPRRLLRSTATALSLPKKMERLLKARPQSLPPSQQVLHLRHQIALKVAELERALPVASFKLRRSASVGGVVLSILSLALSFFVGPHVGLMVGASMLLGLIIVGLAMYTWESWHHRRDVYELAQELLTLKRQAERQLLPQDDARRAVTRACEVGQGGLQFIVLEILRGTVLEPLVAGTRYIMDLWRAKEQRATQELLLNSPDELKQSSLPGLRRVVSAPCLRRPQGTAALSPIETLRPTAAQAPR